MVLGGHVGQIFPFPNKKFAFNLTHILLFAILISLLAMTHHPAQDALQTETEKSLKKARRCTFELLLQAFRAFEWFFNSVFAVSSGVSMDFGDFHKRTPFSGPSLTRRHPKITPQRIGIEAEKKEKAAKAE